MKIAIHQPHYFPWLGYMDKMAKTDRFVILNEAQLTERSNMFRNKFASSSGSEKYLTLSYRKGKHLEIPFKEVRFNSDIEWQTKHRNFIFTNYRKADFFDEIWENISNIFEKKYDYIYDVDMDSIIIIRKLLDIKTPLIFQSELEYDKTQKKDDMVLEICKCLGANYYLSGNGARKYMDTEKFRRKGVQVAYQDFEYPIYHQFSQNDFVPNLSTLDILFHLGIDKARKVFWDNVEKGKEFEKWKD